VAVSIDATQHRKSGSKAVEVSGLPDVDAQSLVLAINETLGCEFMNTSHPRMIRQGNVTEVTRRVEDMNNGRVGALLIAGVNPVYSLPNSADFVQGLEKVATTLAFSMKVDETAKLCKFVAATPHYLESWGDIQFTQNDFSLMQPTIRPLFDTRQFQECLLKWSGNSSSYYDYIRETWDNNLGNTAWNDALHDGVFKAVLPSEASEGTPSAVEVAAAARRLSQNE
jgi:molybdopterin-containing oxidoreductase family iron-sulfur binding subunit